MNQIIPTTYLCSYCGEPNETAIDPSGGTTQTYTEDCTVCCRPNVLVIRIENDDSVTIEAIFEG